MITSKLYRHYKKGDIYQFISIPNEITGEYSIMYAPLGIKVDNNNKIKGIINEKVDVWFKAVHSWNDIVTTNLDNETGQLRRFEEITDDLEIECIKFNSRNDISEFLKDKVVIELYRDLKTGYDLLQLENSLHVGMIELKSHINENTDSLVTLSESFIYNYNLKNIKGLECIIENAKKVHLEISNSNVLKVNVVENDNNGIDIIIIYINL